MTTTTNQTTNQATISLAEAEAGQNLGARNRTDRPEWWDDDEDGYGDEEENRIRKNARERYQDGPDARKTHAITAMIRIERLQRRAEREHERVKKEAATAESNGDRRKAWRMIDAAEANMAEATHHAEQARLWAQAEAEARTEAEAEEAAVQAARHENKADCAADRI